MCRETTKPKDIKFKRISKAKSRSLEELRDQLRWQQIMCEDEDCGNKNSIDDQDLEKSNSGVESISLSKAGNRLTALREYLKQYGGMAGINQRSLDSNLQFPSSLQKPDVGCNENEHSLIG